MDTRFKLEEARYFLKILTRLVDPEKSNFYLSAFLSAWRSVLDVTLFDFIKYYPLGLSEESQLKITDRDFWVAANALNHEEALKFIKWWRQKADMIRKHPLSKERNKIVHKEYPPRILYAPSTLSSSAVYMPSESMEPAGSSGFPGAIPVTTAVSPFTIEIKFPDLLEECKRGFDLMESIVNEAEKEFSVEL